MSVVTDIAAKAASLLSRSAATDLSHGRQAVVGCRLEPSPVGAKDSKEIFCPYGAHRHIGPTVHGLAPVATICRRAAALIGCASRDILDSRASLKRGGCAIKKTSRSILSSRRRGGVQPQQNSVEFGHHPVRSITEASRYFIDVASTPPRGGGENCRPLRLSNRPEWFTFIARSDHRETTDSLKSNHRANAWQYQEHVIYSTAGKGYFTFVNGCRFAGDEDDPLNPG
jgi:hypothetical protein